ncbi:hypothetical protein [Terasakiella pusilla]|uniref:hypothetical protein n=1 Tax=Terasakiella pusilla TaxID=64973 RepID=UPI00048D939B|nr:hypothetical protein [Terasakiella pusilla]
MKDITDEETIDLENHINAISDDNLLNNIEENDLKESLPDLSKEDKERCKKLVEEITAKISKSAEFEEIDDLKSHYLYEVAINNNFKLENSLTDILDKPDLTHKVFMMLLLMADKDGFVKNVNLRLQNSIPYSENQRDIERREVTLKRHIQVTHQMLEEVRLINDEGIREFSKMLILTDFKRKIRDPLVRNISNSLSILEQEGYLVKRYYNIQKRAERGFPESDGYWSVDKGRYFKNGLLDVFLTNKALRYKASLQGIEFKPNSLVSENSDTVH